MENILLQYSIPINTINQACTGGLLWIFTPPKNLPLFDSLGLDGFKFFIVDNDENIDKLLYNFRKCKVSITNQKLTLCTMKFSINNWEKLAYTKKKQHLWFISIIFL